MVIPAPIPAVVAVSADGGDSDIPAIDAIGVFAEEESCIPGMVCIGFAEEESCIPGMVCIDDGGIESGIPGIRAMGLP